MPSTTEDVNTSVRTRWAATSALVSTALPCTRTTTTARRVSVIVLQRLDKRAMSIFSPVGSGSCNSMRICSMLFLNRILFEDHEPAGLKMDFAKLPEIAYITRNTKGIINRLWILSLHHYYTAGGRLPFFCSF